MADSDSIAKLVDRTKDIKITANPHTAEYWDTPGGRVASLLSFVKAKVTEERYEGAEQGTVTL